MGDVIGFHAAVSAVSAGREAASVSKVTFSRFFSPASLTSSDHRRAGIPRVRQVLTVDAGTWSAAETAPVPPRSSITASGVMGGNIVRRLRTSQAFARRETTFSFGRAPIGAMATTLGKQAARLIATREALGFPSQTDFCKEIKAAKNVYNPFETGKRPITLGMARKIKKRFGIPLDWTLDGDQAQKLPADIFNKIGHLAA